MKNSTHKRFKLALLLVPILILVVMAPITRQRRRIALTQQLMQEARTQSRLEVMRQLVEQGADVNYQLPDQNGEAKGDSALHFLARRYQPDQSPQMMLLLSHGASIDILNENGVSPLMLAASIGASPSVRFLIQNGANVNVKAPPSSGIGDGATALKWARGELALLALEKGSVERVQNVKENIKILEAAGAKE